MMQSAVFIIRTILFIMNYKHSLWICVLVVCLYYRQDLRKTPDFLLCGLLRYLMRSAYLRFYRLEKYHPGKIWTRVWTAVFSGVVNRCPQDYPQILWKKSRCREIACIFVDKIFANREFFWLHQSKQPIAHLWKLCLLNQPMMPNPTEQKVLYNHNTFCLYPLSNSLYAISYLILLLLR